ncbi:MAG TPA: ABC transporter permease [Actinomycetota bacterium]|nr:ABC transporter permease [Actinomycetota bacterium]
MTAGTAMGGMGAGTARDGLRADQGPPAELRFRRRIRVGRALRELWRARELVLVLAERELRARYKQAVLGAAWALLTPLALMVVFTLFVARLARVDTGGTSYPLFAYLGLLPWTFFSTSVSVGGQSLIVNANLLNKVYCPREVFPLSSVAVAATDVAVASTVLAVLFAVEGVVPAAASLWVPLLAAIQLAFTVGAVLLVSAVLVYLRDLRHALPILLQLGLLATPVAYGIEVVPARFRLAYAVLNPLGPLIDGYRRTVLLGLPPRWGLVAAAAASAGLTLVVGFLVFKRLETGFADVA